MRKFLFAAAAAVVTLFGLTPSAKAAFLNYQIRYSTDGITWSTGVSDGDALDTNSTAGVIAITANGFKITASTTGDTTTSISALDISVRSIGLGPTAGGTLFVQASADGLLTSPPPLVLTDKFTDSTQLPNSNVLAQTFVSSNSPGLFNTATGIVLNTNPLGVSQTVTNVFALNVSPQYAITDQVSFTYQANPLGVTLGLDLTTRIVSAPAPAGLVLALTGLPVLGLGRWLRRSRARA